MDRIEELGMEAKAIKTRLLELAEDVLDGEVSEGQAEAAATVLAAALSAVDTEIYTVTARTQEKGVTVR